MSQTVKQKAEALLKALNEAIADGAWDETNFISIVFKRLNAMRDALESQLAQLDEEPENSTSFLARQMAMQSTLKQVFVGLYSIEGVNLQAWERIVANLRRQMVSRPVYEKEEDIQAIIKTKDKKINEAYVSIYVDPQSILTLNRDKVPVDKLGKSMLVLKDNAINLENIDYFMHLSGKYRYIRGKLIKMDDGC